MAVTNALKNVVSDILYKGATESSKFTFLRSSQYERAAQDSNECYIIGVGATTTKTYDGSDITFGNGNATKVTLKCNQKKYVAEKFDTTERLVPDYMMKLADKSVISLGASFDAYITTFATKANSPTNWIAGALDAVIDVNSSNIMEIIGKMQVNLDKANAPQENRFIGVTPEIMNVIRLAAEKRITVLEPSLDTFYTGGNIQKIRGFNLVVTNQYTAEAGGEVKLLYGHNDGIIAAQIDGTLEIFKPEGNFSDAFKYLYQYDATVNDATLMGAAYVKVIAEA